MPRIEVIKDFAWAEQGIYVTEYAKGDVVDVSDDCSACAFAEKWAKPIKAKVTENAAPETLAETSVPETKGSRVLPGASVKR